MRRAIIRATVLAALVLSALGPATVQASHQEAMAQVIVYHGDKAVASYLASGECSGESCTVAVATNNRDGGRVARWCGDRTVTLTVPSGTFGQSIDCAGSSTWFIRVNVLLLDGDGISFGSHSSAVDVNVATQ